jgi:hypothetical protein
MFARNRAATHQGSRPAPAWRAPPAPSRPAVGNQASLRRLVAPPRRIDGAQDNPPVQGPTAPVPLDENKPKAPGGKAAAPAAAAPCAEAPNFNYPLSAPVTILGDTVVEFLNNSNAQIGDPHANFSETHTLETNDAGVVTKVNMKCDISIVRPRWGGGRGSDKEKALISKAVDLIKDHEKHHQAIDEQWAAAAVCAALGKKAADAEKAINDVVCKKMAAAQEDYDVLYGQISVVKDAAGAPADVVAGPVAKRPNYKC